MSDSTTKISGFFLLWLCIYMFIYLFPFPMDQIPGMEAYVFKYYYGLHDKVILLAGTHILGLEDLQKIEITGSGDTTFDYVALFTFSLLSLLLAIGIYIFYYRKL